MNRIRLIVCATALAASTAFVSAEPQPDAGAYAFAFAEPQEVAFNPLVAKVENADGSTLHISCDAGRSGRPTISLSSKRLKFRHKEHIQIVVGDEAFEFDFKPHVGGGLAELNSSGAHAALARMIRIITLSKAKHLVVEVPLIDQKETFPLKDAAATLRGRTGEQIAEACL